MLEPYVQTLEVIRQTPTPAMPRRRRGERRLTNRQLDFLRQLRKHPDSLPLMAWPRATTLRKWMRRPRFRMAIESLEESFQVEARLLMAGAAAQAANHLQTILTGGSKETSGMGCDPAQLDLYRRTTKQMLQVLWMEMSRRDQRRRAGLNEQIQQRMLGVTDETDALDYVI